MGINISDKGSEKLTVKCFIDIYIVFKNKPFMLAIKKNIVHFGLRIFNSEFDYSGDRLGCCAKKQNSKHGTGIAIR